VRGIRLLRVSSITEAIRVTGLKRASDN